MPALPVAIRAIRNATSIASVPEQLTITLSISGPCNPARRSQNSIIPSCRYRLWTFSVLCARVIASTTRGLAWPTQGTLLYMST